MSSRRRAPRQRGDDPAVYPWVIAFVVLAVLWTLWLGPVMPILHAFPVVLAVVVAWVVWRVVRAGTRRTRPPEEGGS